MANEQDDQPPPPAAEKDPGRVIREGGPKSGEQKIVIIRKSD